ncbi:hypothetical protein Tco_0906861 [Tanacetum coccineum]|uniref:Uncharacterized protein n=1 Tax=Tanacetum coccineum TaxID=301880 RepID=A0ABQ5CHM6_9ASTR
MAEAKSTKKIDWNDPSGNYKISDSRNVLHCIRQSLKVGILIQKFEPMDAEHGSEKAKSPEKRKGLLKDCGEEG